MMTSDVLAIDIGSSSVRASRFGRNGLAGPVARESYLRQAARLDGELDPAAVLAQVRALLARVDADGVRYVVVSSLWHAVLGVNAADKPVTSVFTWEASAPHATAAAFSTRTDEEAYRRRTGAYLHGSYPAMAIAHLGPECAETWSDLASWVVRQLFGVEVGWSRQLAAGSGLWRQDQATWDRGTLDLLSLHPDRLGPIWGEPVALPNGLLPGLRDAVLLPTLADGYCDSVGVGAIGPTFSPLTVGTSGSLRMILPGVVDDVPRGLWRYRVSDRQTAIGGAVSNAGNLLEWVRTNLGIADPLAVAIGEPRPLDDLYVEPHLAGERGPGYRLKATAAVHGLRLVHTAADVAAELVLASLLPYVQLADLMRAAQPTLDTFVASGGVVTRAPLYAQLLSDALDHPVLVRPMTESSLHGAALTALGRPASPGRDRTITPRPTWVRALARRRERAECRPS